MSTLVADVNLASALMESGCLTEAETLLRQAVTAGTKQFGKLHPQVIRMQARLAGCAAYQGQWYKSEVMFQESLAQYEAVLGPSHLETIEQIENVAVCYQRQGRVAEAEPLLRKALALKLTTLGEHHPGVAKSRNYLADNLDDQGRGLEALEHLRAAYSIHQKGFGNDSYLTAKAGLRLGSIFQRSGQVEEGRRLIERGVVATKTALGEQNVDYIDALSRLGSCLLTQKLYAEAQSTYLQALDLSKSLLTERHPTTVACMSCLASSLLAAGKYEEAVPYFRQTLVLRRELLGDTHPDTTVAYANLGFALELVGKTQLAEMTYFQAKMRLPSVRLSAAASAFDRTLAVDGRFNPLERLVRLLAQRGAANEAWQLLESSLGQGTREELSRVLSTSEKRLRRELTADLRGREARLRELTVASEHQEERQRLLREQVTLQHQLAELDLNLHRKYGLAAGTSPPADLATIQAALPKDAALVAWVEPGYLFSHWVCVVRAKGPPRWLKLSGSGADGVWTQEDHELLEEVKTGLVRPHSLPGGRDPEAERILKEQTQALADQRLKPLRPLLMAQDDLPEVRHLLVLPSPSLQGLPLAVLAPDFTFSYVTSGSVLAWLGKKPLCQAPQRILVLADPLFSESRRLPGTWREYEVIRQAFKPLGGDNAVESLLKERATVRNLVAHVTNEAPAQFRYLHLATHGREDTLRSFGSCLEFPPLPAPEGKGKLQPSTLSAAEVLEHWNLDCDLVVLSACDMGRGKMASTEGFLGFTQALLLAGSRSVVLSLWPVNDTATCLLMGRFYENLLGSRDGTRPLPKAQALREAQTWLQGLKSSDVPAALIRSGSRGTPEQNAKAHLGPPDSCPFSHPYYWAGFVLSGDPR